MGDKENFMLIDTSKSRGNDNQNYHLNVATKLSECQYHAFKYKQTM